MYLPRFSKRFVLPIKIIFMLLGLLALLIMIGIAATQLLLLSFHALHWIHLPFWFIWLPVVAILAWCLEE